MERGRGVAGRCPAGNPWEQTGWKSAMEVSRDLAWGLGGPPLRWEQEEEVITPYTWARWGPLRRPLRHKAKALRVAGTFCSPLTPSPSTQAFSLCQFIKAPSHQLLRTTGLTDGQTGSGRGNRERMELIPNPSPYKNGQPSGEGCDPGSSPYSRSASPSVKLGPPCLPLNNGRL